MDLFIDIYLEMIMPLLFILMAGFLILIAAKTLFERRPMVFSARWLFGFVCLALLPSICIPFLFEFSTGHADMPIWIITLLIPLVVLAFAWLQMKGYMAFAISDSYFREALLSSARDLGYTVEETISCLKIKETGQEMQVAIQGWMGTAQIKPANKESTDIVGKIATEMKQYFRTSPGKMNYLTSYFYLIMGISAIGFTIAICSFHQK